MKTGRTSVTSGLLIQEIFQAVTELEICGRIQSFSGRRYAKKS